MYSIYFIILILLCWIINKIYNNYFIKYIVISCYDEGFKIRTPPISLIEAKKLQSKLQFFQDAEESNRLTEKRPSIIKIIRY